MQDCKDCNGRKIKKGSVVLYQGKVGIVVNEPIEGRYVQLEDGYKLRVKDFAKQLQVIPIKKNQNNSGERVQRKGKKDGQRRN